MVGDTSQRGEAPQAGRSASRERPFGGEQASGTRTIGWAGRGRGGPGASVGHGLRGRGPWEGQALPCLSLWAPLTRLQHQRPSLQTHHAPLVTGKKQKEKETKSTHTPTVCTAPASHALRQAGAQGPAPPPPPVLEMREAEAQRREGRRCAPRPAASQRWSLLSDPGPPGWFLPGLRAPLRYELAAGPWATCRPSESSS